MAEEKVETEASPLEETNEEVIDTSDEALNQAADDNETFEDNDLEELKEEVGKLEDENEESGEELEEEVNAEPKDNAERTRLGRKVKANADELRTIGSKLDILIANQLEKLSGTSDTETEDEELSLDEPLTSRELKAMLPGLLKENNNLETKKRGDYEKDFTNELINLGSDLTDDTYNEVYKIFLDKYNDTAVETGIPKTDATVAWLKAERDHALNGAGKQKNSLRSQQAPVVDKPDTRTIPKRKVNTKKLDKAAQEYINKLGLSDDFVASVLGKT